MPDRNPTDTFVHHSFIHKHSLRPISISSQLSAQWAEPPWGAQLRSELGPALQQASALPTEPHCTQGEIWNLDHLVACGIPYANTYGIPRNSVCFSKNSVFRRKSKTHFRGHPSYYASFMTFCDIILFNNFFPRRSIFLRIKDHIYLNTFLHAPSR